MVRYVLVTERPLRGDSRVVRETLPLRSAFDAFVIGKAVSTGALKPRPGVKVYIDQAGVTT